MSKRSVPSLTDVRVCSSLSAGMQNQHTHNTRLPQAWVPRSRADMNSIQPTGESRRGRVLALLCLIYFLVILDAAIVRLALPSIHDALGLSPGSQTWVAN